MTVKSKRFVDLLQTFYMSRGWKWMKSSKCLVWWARSKYNRKNKCPPCSTQQIQNSRISVSIPVPEVHKCNFFLWGFYGEFPGTLFKNVLIIFSYCLQKYTSVDGPFNKTNYSQIWKKVRIKGTNSILFSLFISEMSLKTIW